MSEHDDKIAEIEKRRAERKAEIAKARAAQYAIDLEALDKAEAERGDANVGSVELKGWAPGFATMVIVRMPTSGEFKRYQDRVKPQGEKRYGDVVKAAHELADVCVIYPAKDDYALLREACPGVHTAAGAKAAEMCAAEEREEGKG